MRKHCVEIDQLRKDISVAGPVGTCGREGSYGPWTASEKRVIGLGRRVREE